MLDLIKKLNKKDYLTIAILSIVIICISFVGVISFILYTSENTVYNWKDVYAFGDSYVYYGYIDQAKAGHLLFRDLYQHDSTYMIFNWFWLLLGNVARIFNLSSIFVYFLFKVLLIPLSVFTLYLFLYYIFNDKSKVRLGLILGLFGTGLGIFLTSITVPVDSLVEGSIFASFLSSPHFTLIPPLFILIILNTLLFLDTLKYKYSIYASLLGLLLFQFHPFTIITFISLFISYFLFLLLTKQKNKWQFFKHSLIFFIISSPGVIYHFIMFLKDPWWKIQSLNIILLSPNILILFFTFAPLLFFSIIGIKNKQYFKHIDFFIFWLFINLFVPYLPIAFQRRLFMGFFIALLIFALQGIFYFLNNKKIKLTLLPIIFILFFYTSVAMVAARVIPINNTDKFYIDNNYFIVADWIKQNTNDQVVFLTESDIANIIAGRSLRRTYVGHTAETIDYDIKHQEMINFFTKIDEEERLLFLQEHNIDLLIYDNNWQRFSVFNPELDNNLNKIFEAGDISVYSLAN